MTTINRPWRVYPERDVNIEESLLKNLNQESREGILASGSGVCDSVRLGGHGGHVSMNDRDSLDPDIENDEDPSEEESSDGVSDDDDEPCIYFNDSRHLEPIRGETVNLPPWRLKDKTKTISVALVLCLNVGVDPPDIVKTQPCAKLEAWVDPTVQPQKALEQIGSSLQKNYEKWQPRARYKQIHDPTVEEIKKTITSLRRNAKDDRILFHYNGHGVPKPTVNGEIWVFNRSYTQYIPLSLYDLQSWTSTPAIYVYDCSCAGLIVEEFNQFAIQRATERELKIFSDDGENNSCNPCGSSNPCGPSDPDVFNPSGKHEYYKNYIQLAACSKDQILPMNPDLPADLFTCCLTTPVQIALQWFIKSPAGRLVPNVTIQMLDKIPGQLTDRRTMLGEINWIFTAVTDTIAWNVMSRDLFQQLFRQDLMVASLFRNFLLADRIMRSYNCTPVSYPKLPPTHHHPLWQTWDLAVDQILSQLPLFLSSPPESGLLYRHSSYFSEQLTAFQVWLQLGDKSTKPEQLPIVLQVLLSQVHRTRALDLLSQFLDLGPWAVNLALSVGIFPYVLKLLQSNARELRPLMVFVWAKILALDYTCQVDLVRDSGHKYFIAVLSDPYIPGDHKAMAAFVLASCVRSNPQGQEAAFQSNVIATCLDQLSDPHSRLRRWLCICLGLVWEKFDSAYWCAVRDSAQEKLLQLLEHEPEVEVRAGIIFALGTFINSATERTDHSNNIDYRVGIQMINLSLYDGSPLVRKELCVALQWLVFLFETHILAIHQHENYLTIYGTPPVSDISGTSPAPRPKVTPMAAKGINNNNSVVKVPLNRSSDPIPMSGMTRITSFSSMNGIGSGYNTIWKAVKVLSTDPDPEVAILANQIVDDINCKVNFIEQGNQGSGEVSPPRPHASMSSLGPSAAIPCPKANVSTVVPIPAPFTPRRCMFGDEPKTIDNESTASSRHSIIGTDFVDWSAKYFLSPRSSNQWDPESPDKKEKARLSERNGKLKTVSKTELKRGDPTRMDTEIMVHKTVSKCLFIGMHPFENHLYTVDRNSFSLWSFAQRNGFPDTSSTLNISPPHRSSNISSSNIFSPNISISSSHRSSNISSPHRSLTSQESTCLIGSQANGLSDCHRVTSLQLLNPSSNTLVMLASDDGSIKLWSTKIVNKVMSSSFNSPVGASDNGQLKLESKLVSAFTIFGDMATLQSKSVDKFPHKMDTSMTGSTMAAAVGSSANTVGFQTSRILLKWEQNNGQLVAGGDYKVIRIWDAMTETKLRDIPTDCVTSVSSISSDEDHLICAGCSDGSIRIFDRREAYVQRVRPITFREHSHPIVAAQLFPESSTSPFFVISASSSGDVKFWDRRMFTSIRTMNLSNEITAMTFHPEADVFACATSNNGVNSVNFYQLDGIPGGQIRSYSGFMSQKLSRVNSLSFHPLRPLLAIATEDNILSIHSPTVHGY